MAQASALDLESFIAESKLDERAVASLRAQTPEVQKRVMLRGSLAACSNQSAALMGRIREATMVSPDNLGVAPISSAELDQFIFENCIDEKAAGFLRQEPAHIIHAIMEKGSLAKCSNPSAAVLGRMREIKRAGASAMAMQGSMGMQMALQGQRMNAEVQPGEVESFCRQYQLDERASNALQEEDAHVQRAVIDRGDISGCKNPSAVVLSRIKAAKQHYGSTGMGMTQTIGLNMPAPLPHPSMFAAGGGMPGTAPGGGFAPGLSAGAMGAAHQDFAAMLGDAQGFAAAFGQFGGLSGFGAMGGGGGMGGANRDNPY
eukprot:gnl/TRDRNA2_/TRDRNA2_172768_c1_seq1.p1 gnl/TRDRNA2_/TRDRNA2_172768_c1~~gnl/TRDRNA2_/TRDRNA2_172768_c1_seq1.p1  ORF type:complete len:316 (-),score=55.67 gnl/TRDRNA2_/TRDRNA2_172768_c1_seq1:58-1005(-)